jgi:hypothetical protein
VQVVENFEPDKPWFDGWKKELPLNVLMAVLNYLLPRLGAILAADKTDRVEPQLLEELRKVTVAGVLPVPHPIHIRRYQPNPSTQIWMTAYIWGIMFMKN